MLLLAEFEYTVCSAKMGYFLLLRIVLISEDFFLLEKVLKRIPSAFRPRKCLCRDLLEYELLRSVQTEDLTLVYLGHLKDLNL